MLRKLLCQQHAACVLMHSVIDQITGAWVRQGCPTVRQRPRMEGKEQLLTLPPSFLCLASSCVMMPADVVRTMMPNCKPHKPDQHPCPAYRGSLDGCIVALCFLRKSSTKTLQSSANLLAEGGYQSLLNQRYTSSPLHSHPLFLSVPLHLPVSLSIPLDRILPPGEQASWMQVLLTRREGSNLATHASMSPCFTS